MATRDEVKRKMRVLQHPDTARVLVDVMKLTDVWVHGTVQGRDEEYAQTVQTIIYKLKQNYNKELAPGMQQIKKVKQMKIE